MRGLPVDNCLTREADLDNTLAPSGSALRWLLVDTCRTSDCACGGRLEPSDSASRRLVVDACLSSKGNVSVRGPDAPSKAAHAACGSWIVNSASSMFAADIACTVASCCGGGTGSVASMWGSASGEALFLHGDDTSAPRASWGSVTTSKDPPEIIASLAPSPSWSMSLLPGPSLNPERPGEICLTRPNARSINEKFAVFNVELR
mmetsp:Transcript_63552/g.184343  ORF Transcript_63552/g.184343 Transcript_63552/m.184343 type:complete len:204 (-) Transcript_63552:832-1443(-)